jgi:hypothetical protein
MRYFINENNELQGLCLGPNPENLPTVELEGIYPVGTKYENGAIVPLAPIVPTSITMRQCRLQLLADGVYETVNSAVPTMGQAAVIEWEYATNVDRTNPLVPSIQKLLGWDNARVDRFYTEANTK